jgi:chromosome segregation ATPase
MNGYHSDVQSESPEPAASKNFPRRGRQENLYDDEDDINGSNAGPGEFQAGAIVRVKLTNFVTYENAEFFPGPNLNMVIGPNGTGKSSLVCAICLGLGWGPQFLGRAGQVGEFVKHNTNDAQVEIELQGRPEEEENHIVRVRIIKDVNQREWWLNGKKTSLKAVQALTRSLSIQIDNLCQFLPQDKVSEFAALSPVELLQHTQRAAAPEYMLEWHEDLKKLRKEEKAFQNQQSTDQAHLANLETRQQNLQAEVTRLQERNKIEDRVKFLKYAIPMVEYRVAVDKHKEYKVKKQQAQANLKALEERIAPTLRSITQKKVYQDEIEAVVKEREAHVKSAEQAANLCSINVTNLDEEVQAHEAKIEELRKSQKDKNQRINSHGTKIRGFRARLEEAPVEFNAAEWNERVVSAASLPS